jgi:hypothetical protein
LLLDRYNTIRKSEEFHQELLTGIIASTVGNFSMVGLKKPLQPEDFMPSQWGKTSLVKPKKTRMTAKKREKLAARNKSFMTAYAEAHNRSLRT